MKKLSKLFKLGISLIAALSAMAAMGISVMKINKNRMGIMRTNICIMPIEME